MRIFILGTGRMGAWLTEELCWEHEVCVHDSDQKQMKYFIKVRRLLELEELRDFGPELFINCVPLGQTIAAFERTLPLIPAGCMLADIASVKTGLAEFYHGLGRPFVSSHPMFGPTFATIRDLSDESAVLISESDPQGKAFFRAFYEKLGIRIFESDFEGHDATVAYSLATPFASTMVFAACMKRQDAPGTNFKRHMAIARGLLAEDDRLLAEIMFNPFTIRQLELINSKLAYLAHIIAQRDFEEMQKFLGSLRENIRD
ncbi:MAG TPA: prephenate dehydrogenase/arogenate dehydrogenase family protein [Rectinemataceae bacterium]|nr:prephenate dehydrogenase/arogenate dehydrogenase family protein [Rectinemataceae bacterium]